MFCSECRNQVEKAIYFCNNCENTFALNIIDPATLQHTNSNLSKPSKMSPTKNGISMMWYKYFVRDLGLICLPFFAKPDHWLITTSTSDRCCRSSPGRRVFWSW